MHEIINERLSHIIGRANTIKERIKKVPPADFFVAIEEGQILLHSIITRLQALAENVKQIQKLNLPFFDTVLSYDIKPIVRFRNLALHHYESLNHAMIYHICMVEVTAIRVAVAAYLDKQEWP